MKIDSETVTKATAELQFEVAHELKMEDRPLKELLDEQAKNKIGDNGEGQASNE